MIINNYYLYLVLNNLRIGFALILNIWAALHINKEISIVGKIFFIGCIVNILLGPMLGIFIDKHAYRPTLSKAHLLILIAYYLPILAFDTSLELYNLSLYCMTVLTTCGNILANGATNHILQSVICSKKIPQQIAKFSLVQQICFIISMSCAGIVLKFFGIKNSYLLLCIVSFITLIVTYYLPNPSYILHHQIKIHYLKDLVRGLIFIFQTKFILLIGLVNILVMSVSSLSNIIMPALIKFKLHGTSESYGNIEASWTIGSVVATIFLTSYTKKYNLKNYDIYSLIILGILCIILAFLYNIYTITFIYALMGACFTFTKTLNNGDLLTHCPKGMIGRVNTSFGIMGSIISIIIFLLPNYISIHNFDNAYFIYGVILLILSILILSYTRIYK
ncbi:enterobactin exporter EntS [Rickettsiales bacterium Ac37b]|nr:enterobactin exporter EntS [Rickettsiales bacterium Ac37b]